jgi:hypothetical protein
MTTEDKLDKIIEYCEPFQGRRPRVDIDEIQKQVLPDSSHDEIFNLFTIIKEQNAAWVNVSTTFATIEFDARTYLFLQQGNFSERRSDAKRKRLFDKLKYGIAKWQRITFWPLFVFAITGWIIAIMELVDNSAAEAREKDKIDMSTPLERQSDIKEKSVSDTLNISKNSKHDALK